MVNSLFDGMNLVAKEAPAVNTRDGVLMLSENTGSHEELADCALSVNPFDIQEQADAIYRALTMDPEERRRKHLILRVDRADLSKNVLRGFTAFDTFLSQHPEFREEVTFIAHLQPSRQDVPEYAEYLERIEALVAVVNHRHGTTDWMPIDLKIYENFHDAVAATSTSTC